MREAPTATMNRIWRHMWAADYWEFLDRQVALYALAARIRRAFEVCR